ncbi:hypothetical protein ABPG75_009896 [Micractinium tetrahymenae]
MRAAHVFWAAAVIALTVPSTTEGRSLRQDDSPSPSPSPEPSPSPCDPLADFLCNGPSDGRGTGCGTLGQACCEKELHDYTSVLACNSDQHYCLEFPSSPTAGDGEASPSLCLPLPEDCGAAGGTCCPLTGDKENGSQRCNDEGTICLTPNSTTIYGSLAYDDYRAFKANPYAPLPAATAASVFGTCTVFSLDQCGGEGGLCGEPLPYPAPQCPEDTRACLSWLYCKEQEGQWQPFGLCTEIPLGCGDLGGSCCPYGNYSVGNFSTPFCWAPNVFCAANACNISDTECRPLPVSPKQCGAPGGPCCPSAYGLVTDKPLPSPCQDGAYCVGGGFNATTPGICVLNPPDCGTIANPCCARDGRVGTVYECTAGFYCPDEGDFGVPSPPSNSSGGGSMLYAEVGPGDRVCQECNAMVAPQYQAICGIGIDVGSPGPSPPPSPPPRPPYPPIFYPPFAFELPPAAMPPAAMPPGAAPSPLVAPAPGAAMAPSPPPLSPSLASPSPLPASPSPLPAPSPSPGAAPSPLLPPPALSPSPSLTSPSPAPAPAPSPGFSITEGPAAAPPLPAPGPSPAAAPAPMPGVLPGDLLAPELAPGPAPAVAPAFAPLPGPAPAPAPAPEPSMWHMSPSPSPSPSPEESPSPSPDYYDESPSPSPDEESPSPSPDEDRDRGPPSEEGDESPRPSPDGDGDADDESPSPDPEDSPSPDPEDSPSPSPDESPSPSPERDVEARLKSPSPDNWTSRRLFQASPAARARTETEEASELTLNDLPDAVLLEVFRQLARLPPVTDPEEEALYSRRLPFRTFEFPGEVHPGLRAYPFLAQVCRHWKRLLESPAARQALWGELCIDFGHELITGVHVPVAWSDIRPTDEEFAAAFAAVRLQSHRLVEFVRARRGVLRSLTLANSEGYFSEDGEFVPVNNKHNFNLGTLGIVLGMLQDRLEHLHMVHCNDLFAAGSPLSTIAMVSGLRSLALDDLQCRVYREPLAELGRLTQLRELMLTATQRHGVFIFGIDTIPDTWAQLTNLRSLELRGNALLEALPPWMPEAMPHLHCLDVSACSRLDLGIVTAFTQLKTLALQAMDLVSGTAPPRLVQQATAHGLVPRVKPMPRLAHMTNLTALNLADNNLSEVPPCIFKLTGLEVLDLSGNFYIEVKQAQALTPLHSFSRLRWLDLRAVHVEEGGRYWSPAKCTTMQHVAALAKALRRRNRHAKVLHDTS